jgi:hypothetical protein
MSKPFSACFFIHFFLFIFTSVVGFTQLELDTIDNPYSSLLEGDWIVPSGVTELRISCWGGGGGGGVATGQAAAGGGGSGGAFASGVFSVIPGQIIHYSVGNGGSGGMALTGGAGGSTFAFNNTTLLAVGGIGGHGQVTSYGTAAGGLATSSGNIGGDTHFYGGSGGTGGYGPNGSEAGGGGGGAGSQGNGFMGGGTIGGQGGAGGGGNGAWTGGVGCNCNGSQGSIPGGGGSGGQAGGPSDRIGGTGGGGRIVFGYTVNGVQGRLFSDSNNNCLDDSEMPVSGVMVMLDHGLRVTSTDDMGFWRFENIPSGPHIIEFDSVNYVFSVCGAMHEFDYASADNMLDLGEFGLTANLICTSPELSIYTGAIRPCFTRVLYAQLCNENEATSDLENPEVDIQLDPNMELITASLSYIPLGNNEYRFFFPTLNPNECELLTVGVHSQCNLPEGSFYCVEARLNSGETCFLDAYEEEFFYDSNGNIPSSLCNGSYDNSEIRIRGECSGDSVKFVVSNIGNGDMLCPRPIYFSQNGVMSFQDEILIQSADSIEFAFEANGLIWVAQSQQHPMFLGDFLPMAFVESCGAFSAVDPFLLENLSLNDASCVSDSYCSSYFRPLDPNDKRVMPNGWGEEHLTIRNEQLEYTVRFQNVGSDTAFNVVVLDTMDLDLNLFTFIQGPSSHPYTFNWRDGRVAEWRFDNINLLDSLTNEELSHGFLNYTIRHNDDIPEFAQILNSAAIYFDFEAPIITNSTLNTIVSALPSSVEVPNISDNNLHVFPNPTADFAWLNFQGLFNYRIYNINGAVLKEESKVNYFDFKNLADGIYVAEIFVEGGVSYRIRIVKQS